MLLKTVRKQTAENKNTLTHRGSSTRITIKKNRKDQPINQFSLMSKSLTYRNLPSSDKKINNFFNLKVDRQLKSSMASKNKKEDAC
jgi:hypothetical protein